MKLKLLFAGLLLVSSLNLMGQRFGKDSMACITNLSLYIEDYKLFKEGTGSEESFDNMVNAWKWVFVNCPMASENIYIDGAAILKEIITKDLKRKKGLLDTLMLVYDNRIRYFGKEGFVLGRKGVDLYTYAPERYSEVYSILKRSVELEGKESNNASLVYYFRVTIKMAEEGKMDKSVIVDTYDQISDILDYNIALKNANSSKYENSQRNIELSFEPYASCTDLVNIYSTKFNSSPDDIEMLKKIIRILDKKNCTDNQLYMDANVRLYRIEPNASSAYLLGKMYMKKQNFSEASKYFSKCTDLEPLSERADCYLLNAHALFSLKQYSNARAAALAAAQLRPDDGRPYILVGDMYAVTAQTCGDNKLTSKVAFWAAVDKYIKAKSIDPKLEKDANEKIATYSRYFPPIDDIFFYELAEGQSYNVGCWIGETTTVRALKQ